MFKFQDFILIHLGVCKIDPIRNMVTLPYAKNLMDLKSIIYKNLLYVYSNGEK
jgi:hypothetical protein